MNPFVIFAYNTTPHTATEFTSFELVYGRQAELPITLTKQPAIQYNLDDYLDDYNLDDKNQELKKRIRAANKLARKNLSHKKQIAK